MHTSTRLSTLTAPMSRTDDEITESGPLDTSAETNADGRKGWCSLLSMFEPNSTMDALPIKSDRGFSRRQKEEKSLSRSHDATQQEKGEPIHTPVVSALIAKMVRSLQTRVPVSYRPEDLQFQASRFQSAARFEAVHGNASSAETLQRAAREYQIAACLRGGFVAYPEGTAALHELMISLIQRLVQMVLERKHQDIMLGDIDAETMNAIVAELINAGLLHLRYGQVRRFSLRDVSDAERRSKARSTVQTSKAGIRRRQAA